MSRQFTAVDLSRLPSPAIVEPLDFESILNEMLAELRALDPDQFNDITESDPAYKILVVCAYRELKVRQRVNDAARAVMLAHAAGTDLDNILAREPYNISRQLIDPGDPDAVPPIDPTWESDEDFRRRGQLAPEAYSTAGSEGAYIFHSLSADPQVLDARPDSPEPGQARITILSRQGTGVPSPELLDTVEAALSQKTVRPFTDEVIVAAATIVEYEIEAELTLFDGPSEDVVLAEAQQRVEAYRDRIRRLGLDVAASGIDGALHCEGVMKVHRIKPEDNIEITDQQASYCTGITLTVVGRGE